MEEFTQVPDESVFFDLTPEEVTLIFFLLGISISSSLTIDELNVLANGLFLTAQVLFTISAQRTLLNDAIEEKKDSEQSKEANQSAKNSEKEDNKSIRMLELEIKKLQEQIENMQKQIKELEN